MTFPQSNHRRSNLIISIKRVLISFLCAGLSNFLWLAVFLTLAEKPPGGPVSWLLWFLEPLITALGFSYGIILFDYNAFKNRRSLFTVLPLPLVGCAVGALIAFQFGSMFIGFGTLALGAIAVLFREAAHSREVSGAA